MDRKTHLFPTLTAAALAASLVLAGCAGATEPTEPGDTSPGQITEADINPTIDTSQVKKELVVAVDNPYYLFHVDVLIAQREGYFKEVGIDNVEIVTVEDPLPALIGGSLDFALYNTDNTFTAAERSGSGLKFLATHLGGEANILGVRAGINTAADLKGATLTGGQFNGRNDFILRQLLKNNGVDPENDVTLVSTGGQSNQRLQAIIAGTVDGASLQLRHEELLKAEGGKFLFMEIIQIPQNGWVASEKLMKESKETAAAFIAGMLKGRQYVLDLKNKDNVLDYMASLEFDLPEPYRAAYENEHDPEYHTFDGGFEVADMDEFIAQQIELEVVPAGLDWRKHVDLLPLWRAQKALGLELRPGIGE